MKNVESALNYLSQIRRVYAERLNIKFGGESFSPNEISVLILLSNNKTINTCGKLTTVLGVSKGLVSRSLASLERKRLIEIRLAEDDRRSRYIVLTEASKAVICQLREGIREINDVILEDISEEEIEQMENTMRRIIERFEAASGNKEKGE